MMQLQNTLLTVGETLTEKIKVIKIDRYQDRKTKIFQRRSSLKYTIEYEIHPISVGNRFRISGIATKIPSDVLDLNLKATDLLYTYFEDFIGIVAICVQNNCYEPSKELIDELKSAPVQILFSIIEASIGQSDLSLFYRRYHLDKRKKCVECAGAGCDICEGSGLDQNESSGKPGDGNPWQLIGSYRKYFKCSREEVLWGMSYINFIMDLASIPSTDDKPGSKEQDQDEVVDPADEEDELKEYLKRHPK